MQRSGDAPQYHTARYPDYHAILSSQSRAEGLESDEESEEEGHGCVHSVLVESNISREVCGLGVSNL
jgi:hypothetical protein